MRNLSKVSLLAGFFVSSSVFALGIEGSIGGWSQDPSGYASYKGDSLDVDRDLRYGKKTKLMARLKIQTPSILPNFYLMATQSNFSGQGSKNVQFKFGDKTFQENVPFYSEAKLHHYDIGLYYNMPFLGTTTAGVLKAEFGINARILDLKVRVRQEQNNIDESKSLIAPVPMVYAGVGIRPITFVSLEGEFRGIAYGKNHYYDSIARVKIKPIAHTFVAGGYRWQDLKIDVSDVKSKLKLKGLFAEAGFEF
ncbi:MAG: TIGR04219 family outer membrane beta-barrel protein [Aquificaceae bacterium]